jgi:hypothetical protein
MFNRALRILGVAVVSGLSGCSAAWAQMPAPAADPEAVSGIAAGWADLQRLAKRSVDELSQREMWAESAHWRVALSPYTKHYRYSVEHRHVYAVALERHRDDGWLAGASMFRNSFGQPSSYVYLGRRFDNLFDQPQLFGQASAGMLYGYKGAYQTKVPLNFRGFSPGALLSMGWRSQGGVSIAGHLLGDAGVMLQLALDLK